MRVLTERRQLLRAAFDFADAPCCNSAIILPADWIQDVGGDADDQKDRPRQLDGCRQSGPP